MNWPKPGDKVKFKGAEYHWHRDMIDNANENLKIGETYTLSRVQPLSSWVIVELEGFDDITFSLAFFDYEKPDSTREGQ